MWAPSSSTKRDAPRVGAMAPRLPAPTTGPDACKVWEIKTQAQARGRRARAREMLERTAWQVQPIMRARGWRVGTLLGRCPTA